MIVDEQLDGFREAALGVKLSRLVSSGTEILVRSAMERLCDFARGVQIKNRPAKVMSSYDANR